MTLIDYLKKLYRQISSPRYGWSGDYPDWASVKLHASGYDSSFILGKIRQSTIKVASGEAVYERDSVLFDRVEYSWPLLSALQWVAAKNGGRLNVLDFGGSLGSSWFQNKLFLDPLAEVKWNVVEQNNFVECGRKEIENNTIRFFYSPEDCIASVGLPDILILSCVLPYLEKPYEVLDRLMDLRIPHIILDNTFFNYKDCDRLTLQKVPPGIYPASYPCWFLSWPRIVTALQKNYRIFSEHNNDVFNYLDGYKIPYRGLLATLKQQ